MKGNHSPSLIWQRLRQQGPINIALRLWVPLERRLTGAPVWRHCEVAPGLYLGGQHGRRGLAAMRARGITHTISLRAEFDDAEHGLTRERYLHLPTNDGAAPSLDHLQAGVAFIAQALTIGEGVYVHCWVGVGRAATLVAAYLIANEGLTVEKALLRIESVRPFIWLSGTQRERLREFAEICAAV